MTNNYFFFYQKTPKGVWYPAPASDRERILNEERPPFCTVLDVDNDFALDLTKEEQAAVKYRGNFYADFDGADEDFSVVIAQFQKFLAKLQDHGLNLDQCHLAATGGRGFHAEVPMSCMMLVVPADGIAGLPSIFKELAFALFVETLDLRVYSAKRGRAWRTYGVERENGKFKVAITVAEALSMTPERYNELCSAPRDLINPEPPTLAKGLARLFTDSCGKVAVAVAKNKKRVPGKAAKALKHRLDSVGYPLPPSLLTVASGHTPTREGAGFNQIAMQLAIAAIALGVTEDELITLCAGLISNHQSDGSKYHTPRRRENQLRQQFHYMEASHYDLSVGGIRSILPKNAVCPDLKGL